MRVLTIRQPYPEAIIRGLKGWETRSRRTLYRGPVAIHAAARWEPGWRNVWVDLDPRYWAAWDGGRLPTGAVVAVAELTDCVPILDVIDTEHHPGPYIERGSSYLDLWTQTAAGPHGYDEWERHDISDQLPYGHWEFNSWAWRLNSVRRISSPIPAKGRLGLWNPYGYPLPGDPDGDLGAEIVRALETG